MGSRTESKGNQEEGVKRKEERQRNLRALEVERVEHLRVHAEHAREQPSQRITTEPQTEEPHAVSLRMAHQTPHEENWAVGMVLSHTDARDQERMSVCVERSE
eukprot:1380401-Rhodomonas_salina.2